MTNLIKNTNDTATRTVKSKVNESDMEALNCEGNVQTIIGNVLF